MQTQTQTQTQTLKRKRKPRYRNRVIFGWAVGDAKDKLRIPLTHLLVEEPSKDFPDALIAVAACDRRRKFRNEFFNTLANVRGATRVCRECEEIARKYNIKAKDPIKRSEAPATEVTEPYLEG